MNTRLFISSLALVAALGACAPATQNIPVSTNPSGAVVYADGKEMCITPCNVELEKTQAHILTLKKDGYRQADVQISQQYDTGSVARDAVQSGVWQKSVGGNTDAAISNALLTANAKEQDGSAYVLTPSSVVVQLAPEGQTIQQAQASTDAPITISSDQLSADSQKRLKGDENGADAPIVLSPDQLSSDSQQLLKQKETTGQQATVSTTQPATMGSAAQDDPAAVARDVLEAGAIAAPTVGTKKSWTTSKSSSESYSGGSYSKTTTSTKVGASVSVNPVEAGLGLLDLLEGSKSDSSSETPAE